MIKQRLLQTLIESYGGIEPLIDEIEQLMEFTLDSDAYGIKKNAYDKDFSASKSLGDIVSPEMKSGNKQHALTRISNAVNYTKDPGKTLSNDDKKYVSDLNAQLNGGTSSKTSSPARTGSARASTRAGSGTKTTGRSFRQTRPVSKTTSGATGTQQVQQATPTGQTVTTASQATNTQQPSQQNKQKPFGWNRYSNDAEGRKQEDWDNDELETGGIGNMRKTASEKPVSQGGTPSTSSASAVSSKVTPQSRGYVQGQKFGSGTGGNYTHSDYKSWSSDQQKAFAKNNPNTVRQWNGGNTNLQARQVRGPRPIPQATANILDKTTGTSGIGSSYIKV